MYVSIENRIKILRIFYENNLISAKKRFHKLKEYTAAENVFVTINTIKRIIFRYIFDGTLSAAVQIDVDVEVDLVAVLLECFHHFHQPKA